MSDGTNRRANFRLRYPPGAGPLFVVGGTSFRVVELSERGLQFSSDGPTPTEEVAGALKFPDGAEIAVAGAAVRAVRGQVAVRLTRGIPLGRVLAEQRRIMRSFPDFLPGTTSG